MVTRGIRIVPARRGFVAGLALLGAACGAGGGEGGGAVPGHREDSRPFAGIGAGETLRASGTEPFWNATIAAGRITYTTPEAPDGISGAAERFAGRGGLSFSGTVGGQPFDLMVTEGQCSDGMSDRVFPFVATLAIAGEQRQGCAWSDSRPFTGPAAP